MRFGKNVGNVRHTPRPRQNKILLIVKKTIGTALYKEKEKS